MGTGNRDDSRAGGKFVVEIDGVNVGNFKKVSGLDSRTGVIIEMGGKDKTARKIPGKTEYQNIVLERGFTGSDELWKWRKTVLDGKVERKSGSIIMMEEDNETECMRYNFYEAWPVKWEGPSLAGGGTDIMVETLEITHEKVERA